MPQKHSGVAVLVVWSMYTAVLGYGYYFGVSGVQKHNLETAWIVLIGLGWALALFGRRSHEPAEARPLSCPPSLHIGLLFASSLLGTYLIYQPALSLGLLSDDFVLVTRAVRRDFWVPGGFFRPGPLLLWAGLFELVGIKPFVLHALNLLLHSVNTCLVVLLAFNLGLRAVPAVIAGALFLTFPASVEAVAWSSGIHDLLMTFGCLLFVLAYRARGSRSLAFGLAIGLILGLASKETAAIAPVLALTAWWGSGKLVKRHSMVLTATALVLCAGYAVWTVTGVNAPADYAVVPSRYFLKELIARPFATLGSPWSEHDLQQAPILGPLSVVALLALFGQSTTVWRSLRAHFWLANRLTAWIVLAVAPVYSLFFVSTELQGSRYLYLSCCAWSILLAHMVDNSFTSSVVGRLGRRVKPILS